MFQVLLVYSEKCVLDIVWKVKTTDLMFCFVNSFRQKLNSLKLASRMRLGITSSTDLAQKHFSGTAHHSKLTFIHLLPLLVIAGYFQWSKNKKEGD